MSDILKEFCHDAKPSEGMYVSLSSLMNRDWRREFCFLGRCKSGKLQRMLKAAWKVGGHTKPNTWSAT